MLAGLATQAQESHQQHSTTSQMPGMAMGDEERGLHSHADHIDPAALFLMSESSGTAFQPSAWPMPMLMQEPGGWHLMWMAQAFLVDTQQTGPRGADKLYSTNWGMLGAVHSIAGGQIMLRTMLSLEPATVTKRQYPLLFQSGETAYGKPIVDGQHPHDFVMELSLQYARKLGSSIWNVYYAPVGDPALGPVAYPHRASAMEIPQAALGHHWQDSSHIVGNVLTSGVSWKKLRLEASGFHGAEPDEYRWDIDFGAMDSYSGRATFTPTPRWLAQVSAGHLTRPEALETGDVNRTTASLQYVLPRSHGHAWSTTLLWGQDDKLAAKYRINAVLAESVYPFGEKNFVTGRYEWSQRDELFADNPTLQHQLVLKNGRPYFDINSYTVGYTRDLVTLHGVETGLGANISLYGIPSIIKSYYGDHPVGVSFFLRVRLKPSR